MMNTNEEKWYFMVSATAEYCMKLSLISVVYQVTCTAKYCDFFVYISK